MTFPAISSVLDALTVLLGDAKQSDRLLAITCDLCFAILRLDPATQPSLAQLSVQGPGVLTSLQHAASRHLRSVYMTFESHRQSIIVSSLSAILDAYTVKSPTKNFIMHHSAHTEFSGRVKKPRYRSATRSSSRQNASTFSLMTLLSCIQSATNLKAFSESSDETLKQQPAKGKSSKKNTGNGDARSDTDELSSRELLRDCYQGAFHFAVELLKVLDYKYSMFTIE